MDTMTIKNISQKISLWAVPGLNETQPLGLSGRCLSPALMDWILSVVNFG